jgi:5'-3' exonuclease
LDCNSILFDTIRTFPTITDEEEIIDKTIAKINEYILELKPTQNIFIAFDGIPPVAKMKQQRERRFKSVYQKQKETKEKETKESSFDTTAITPGTAFMFLLDKKIKHHFTDPKNFGVENLILSTSGASGEGEHKLFEYIRHFPTQHDHNTVTMIYGLDADLIMLSLNHLHVCNNNLWIFRETPEFIQSIQEDLDPNETYFMDISELAKGILFTMGKQKQPTLSVDNKELQDYIFLCFFLGNDFLPHFPALNIRTGGIDKLLHAYRSTISNQPYPLYLTDGTRICWPNVRKVLQFLATEENNYLKKEMMLRKNMQGKKQEQPQKDGGVLPMTDRSLEEYIGAPSVPGWQTRYYRELLFVEDSPRRKQQICVHFLEGLEWTLKYYTSACPNWRWSYPHHYPPLLKDLVYFLPLCDTELIPPSIKHPVSNTIQLAYVLPRESLYLLSNEIREGLLHEFSFCYPETKDVTFLWAFCKYFWEAHPILPYLSISQLETFFFR